MREALALPPEITEIQSGVCDTDPGNHGIARTVDTVAPTVPVSSRLYIGPKGGRRRSLTVGESARLQSFRDGYPWTGTVGQQFRQVGNAVPPLLARALGESLLRCA